MLPRAPSLLLLLALCCGFWAQKNGAAGFQVFWNVPSSACQRFDVQLDLQQFGFTVNREQEFIGNEITILYHPGLFPQLNKDGISINGGLPQLGNLTLHLTEFLKAVQQKIPDPMFSGLAVIDFEQWQPFLNGSSVEYRSRSVQLVQQQHPDWNYTSCRAEADRQFARAARRFLESSLLAGKQLRPRARWGYYQYPLCSNLHSSSGVCSKSAQRQNDLLGWLYRESTAVYPSLYLFHNNFTNADRRAFVRGHLDEVRRIGIDKPVYPYTWFQYHDNDTYLSELDLLTMLGEPMAAGHPGVVMWGAQANVNTARQCCRLAAYLRTRLGPLVRRLVALDNGILPATALSRRAKWGRMLKTEWGRKLLQYHVQWSTSLEGPVYEDEERVCEKQRIGDARGG